MWFRLESITSEWNKSLSAPGESVNFSYFDEWDECREFSELNAPEIENNFRFWMFASESSLPDDGARFHAIQKLLIETVRHHEHTGVFNFDSLAFCSRNCKYKWIDESITQRDVEGCCLLSFLTSSDFSVFLLSLQFPQWFGFRINLLEVQSDRKLHSNASRKLIQSQLITGWRMIRSLLKVRCYARLKAYSVPFTNAFASIFITPLEVKPFSREKIAVST